MTENDDDTRQLRFVRELCNDLPEGEIRAAEEAFRSYLRTAWSIFERIEYERTEKRNPQRPDSTN